MLQLKSVYLISYDGDINIFSTTKRWKMYLLQKAVTASSPQNSVVFYFSYLFKNDCKKINAKIPCKHT